MGKAPAVYSVAQPFPLDGPSLGWTDGLLRQAQRRGSMFALTLEPKNLWSVTANSATDLAAFLGKWNERGVGIFLRFAPEMNGSWFAWGQQPMEYVTAYRIIAAAVRRLAPGTALVWAPNIAPQGTSLWLRPNISAADRALLDTNHNGRIDSGDSAYAPYYPGDAVVDWVGLSLYFRGYGWPHNHNDLPTTRLLLNQLGHSVSKSGRLSGGFYDTFALRRHKPMMLAETGAAWAPSHTGASELAIKQHWWRQVFKLVRTYHLNAFKLAIFFEVNKAESDISPHTMWAIDRTSTLERAFRADLTRYRVTSAVKC